MISIFFIFLWAVLSGPTGQAGLSERAIATADPTRPVVVELFTSQGCGMCPEANRLLRDISESRDDVIAIAYGVSYWDMFGWEDEYAKPEFMARQEDYVSYGEARRVFTPHFIINGAPQMLRFDPELIESAISIAEPTEARLEAESLADGSVQIRTTQADWPETSTFWLVTLEDGEQIRTIYKGSNTGLDMIHYNMAVDLIRLEGLGSQGASLIHEPGCPDELRCAVLVQADLGGPIISASWVESD